MRRRKHCLGWLFLLASCGHLALGQEQPQPSSDLPPGVRWLRDLEYIPGGHERQKLDLYLPEKVKVSVYTPTGSRRFLPWSFDSVNWLRIPAKVGTGCAGSDAG